MSEFDVSQRFTIENAGARGEIVRLRESFQSAFLYIDYPPRLRSLMGEAMSAAVLLSATIKFEGKLSLQLQGEGPVTLLLVQATHDRKLRGLIKWNGEVNDLNFKELTASSQMVITIDPEGGKQYQGIVPMEGETLSACIENYFNQSEQLPTKIWLTANESTAAGFLLQKMPGHDQQEFDQSWDHVSIIAQSITNPELLSLSFETLLYRLFHSEKVRIFDPNPVRFQCVCSKERCESAVLSLGRIEIESMIKSDEPLDMKCEFCGASYHIDLNDLNNILERLDSPEDRK